MTHCLIVEDYHELLVLHRALMEAKFHPEPVHEELSGSPYLAAISRRLLDVLSKVDGDREGEAASERWRSWREVDSRLTEWKVAVRKAADASIWASWTVQQRAEFAELLLSPFDTSSETVARFLTEVDEVRRGRSDG